MLLTLLVALTTCCVLLTVALLGSLRTLTGIRLQLQGHQPLPNSRVKLEHGRRLPQDLLDLFPSEDGLGLVAFLAHGCLPCRELAADLAEFEGCPVVACVSHPTDENAFGGVLAAIPATPPETAEKLMSELGI